MEHKVIKCGNLNISNSSRFILIAGPFAKLAAWGAIGYGAWTLWKREK